MNSFHSKQACDSGGRPQVMPCRVSDVSTMCYCAGRCYRSEKVSEHWLSRSVRVLPQPRKRSVACPLLEFGIWVDSP
jgi:hypothetical protein